MPTPLGPLGGWGSFAQAPRPSEDPRYTLGTSGGASPSTDHFASDNDEDGDIDQFIRDADSP